MKTILRRPGRGPRSAARAQAGARQTRTGTQLTGHVFFIMHVTALALALVRLRWAWRLGEEFLPLALRATEAYVLRFFPTLRRYVSGLLSPVIAWSLANAYSI